MAYIQELKQIWQHLEKLFFFNGVCRDKIFVHFMTANAKKDGKPLTFPWVSPYLQLREKSLTAELINICIFQSETWKRKGFVLLIKCTSVDYKTALEAYLHCFDAQILAILASLIFKIISYLFHIHKHTCTSKHIHVHRDIHKRSLQFMTWLPWHSVIYKVFEKWYSV